MLRAVLADVIEDASNELTGLARLLVQRAFEHWRKLDEHMKWGNQQIGANLRGSDDAKRAAKITGIGEIGASAFIAGVGDFKQFKGGHQFGAWLGIVPSQNSSGGKASLGRIAKRGDDYLRTLLIRGAKSAVMSAGKRDDPTSRWLQQLGGPGGLAESVCCRLLRPVQVRIGRLGAAGLSPIERFVSGPAAPGATRLSPDSNSPEDCLCLANGQASGLVRSARWL